MKRSPGTFERTLALYDSSPLKKRSSTAMVQEQGRLLQVANQARTFDHWLSIYYRSRNGSAIEKIALKKLARLPVRYNELLDAIENSPLQSPLERVINSRLAKRHLETINTDKNSVLLTGNTPLRLSEN